jgi:serine/threonine protein kinase
MEVDLTNEEIALNANAPKSRIERLERFDSFDMFQGMEALPKAPDKQAATRVLQETTDAIQGELTKLLALGPNNDMLFDLATKSVDEWAKDIEEGMGLDLNDPDVDPSLKKLVEEMAKTLFEEVAKAYPNKIDQDKSTFTLNGETYGNRVFLGKGGGGTVSTYTSLTTGKKVVLKEPNNFVPDGKVDSIMYSDFSREARSHREVTGGENGQAPSNIMAMEGLVLAKNGQPMLVMELADAGNAEDFSFSINAAKETGLISPQAQNAMVQDSIKQMAIGIMQMQESGISHHDLKEANVFIMSDGTFKIADFGLANILDDHDEQVPMTQHTAGYSPQEFYSKGTQGEKSDNFTLGVILDLMTDPTRRMGRIDQGHFRAKIGLQPTQAPDEDGDQAPIHATALDRLRNALLSEEQDARPEMAQVLLSTYIRDVEQSYHEDDVKELRLASIEYSRTAGKTVSPIEGVIQVAEGELRNLELDRGGKLLPQHIEHYERIQALTTENVQNSETKLAAVEQRLTPYQQEITTLGWVPAKKASIRREIMKMPDLAERRRLIGILEIYIERNEAEAKLKLERFDAKQLTAKINDLKAKLNVPRTQVELDTLDQQIAAKRKEIVEARKQIEAIHNDPEYADIVARMKKANEPFK